MTAPVDHVKLSGADTLWSFVLKAVDRLDLLYPIRVKDRDLVICTLLAAFGPELGLQSVGVGCLTVPAAEAGFSLCAVKEQQSFENADSVG